jgi:hypothetical protein
MGRAGGGVLGHLARLLERAAVLEVGGDARAAEGVVAYLGGDAGRLGATAHHLLGVGAVQPLALSTASVTERITMVTHNACPLRSSTIFRVGTGVGGTGAGWGQVVSPAAQVLRADLLRGDYIFEAVRIKRIQAFIAHLSLRVHEERNARA